MDNLSVDRQLTSACLFANQVTRSGDFLIAKSAVGNQRWNQHDVLLSERRPTRRFPSAQEPSPADSSFDENNNKNTNKTAINIGGLICKLQGKNLQDEPIFFSLEKIDAA